MFTIYIQISNYKLNVGRPTNTGLEMVGGDDRVKSEWR